MSDKKFCDFCDVEIDIRELNYYKYVVEYWSDGEMANDFHRGDICEKCFKKGVLIKEQN